jgi:hypothetical protein
MENCPYLARRKRLQVDIVDSHTRANNPGVVRVLQGVSKAARMANGGDPTPIQR